MYLRPHLSRALSLSLSLFRPDLFHSPCTPLRAPRPPGRRHRRRRALFTFRTSPSFLSFPLAMLTLVALTIPRSLFRPLSPSLAPSRFLRRRASARRARALFFPRPYLLSFFFPSTHAPEPSSDFYNLLLVAPHTTGRRTAAVAATAVCPARPTRKNRKIEENKSGRRGAPRIPRGWCARTAVAVTAVVRGTAGAAVESSPGETTGRDGRAGGGPMKKEKGTAGPRRNGSSARVRVRAMRFYPARAAAENYFSAASAPMPAGNSHRICEYRMHVPFAGGRYRLIFFPRTAVADPGQHGIRPAFSLINLSP